MDKRNLEHVQHEREREREWQLSTTIATYSFRPYTCITLCIYIISDLHLARACKYICALPSLSLSLSCLLCPACFIPALFLSILHWDLDRIRDEYIYTKCCPINRKSMYILIDAGQEVSIELSFVKLCPLDRRE